jgi:predicted nucleic acid-binding Zn ribbon protein
VVPSSVSISAKSLLWQGQVEAARALFTDCKGKQAQNFCEYLDKHRHCIINYQYYQAEQICSIGSGAVESTVKQIDRRTKISFFTVEGGKCPSSSQRVVVPTLTD